MINVIEDCKLMLKTSNRYLKEAD
ncbi:hypothetical protein BN175_520004 [Clostridioides difficile T23]|nr:hypothetical protein BN173_580004 [Clostridioides difficile T11]CCL32642.1 hypothetical protein BN174_620004 [Clostridioides difficile E15]CCL36375.1 hypothetical protein BN175_520004 [Clostridioides difficile T23]CCL40178.1 hypothetical protein BN176_650004 [Clostridioides difficile E19]CCL85809.1 hypothetical protein BN188_560004 [Clostridioides difficile T19]